MSGRHFRRQCHRYETEGVGSLRDKRLGRLSNRRAPESELDRMRRLYREEYADFAVKHFQEELAKRHGYTLGYTVTRLASQSADLVQPADARDVAFLGRLAARGSPCVEPLWPWHAGLPSLCMPSGRMIATSNALGFPPTPEPPTVPLC